MAGLLSCLWGEPNESHRQQGLGLVLKTDAKQVNQFGINKFVVEEGTAQQCPLRRWVKAMPRAALVLIACNEKPLSSACVCELLHCRWS